MRRVFDWKQHCIDKAIEWSWWLYLCGAIGLIISLEVR